MDPGTITNIALEIIKFMFKPLTLTLSWVVEKLPFEFKWKRPELGIIQAEWGGHEWSKTKQGDEPIIMVHTRWTITNVLSYNVTALNAYLTKPENTKGFVLIKHPESDIYGSYVIPKGYTTEVHVDFTINPKNIKNDEQKLKMSFYFEDSIGRKYKRSFIANPPRKSVVKKVKLKIEDPSELSSSIEKRLVSILKNEVEQYKVRGRREGRLGTVEWLRGTIEWRESDKKIKFLYETSSPRQVSSEHADALKTLYNSSGSKNKKVIIEGLISRFDKKSEYRDIVYFIVLCLFEINHLTQKNIALFKKVSGDKAHGFSDALRLLDLLLAFRYDEFDEKMLDELEKLAYETDEHTSSIKQRINAIRVGLIINDKKYLIKGRHKTTKSNIDLNGNKIVLVEER